MFYHQLLSLKNNFRPDLLNGRVKERLTRFENRGYVMNTQFLQLAIACALSDLLFDVLAALLVGKMIEDA